MKNLSLFLASIFLVGAAACGDNGNSGDDEPSIDGGVTSDAPIGGETIRLSEDITSNTTLTANNTYVIPRMKQLFVKNNAVLTIEPGTVIQGDQGSVLVITRGAKIMAEGTADKPIVLTTAQPTGAKTSGFWGGLLVLGNAPINVNTLSTPSSTEATYEAFTTAMPEGKFGGTNPADNSGVLKYVRVEFAGFNFVADREFNNLTLCGVGTGTVVDYVQVHGGSDDGIEIFGGTVNVKHIISSQNQDDGFDTDNGWNGKAQFLVIQNINHPTTLPEASNGYESDNHGTAASYQATPRTAPTVYNATLIGDHAYTGVASFAAVFRRGTGGHYVNHLWYGFPKGPEFRDAETKANLESGALSIKSSMFFGNDGTPTNMPVAQATNDIDEATYIMAAGNGNLTNVDPGMPAGALSKTAPTFKPGAPITGGATPPSDGFFDTSATFIGAVGSEDWTAGWTSYPQN